MRVLAIALLTGSLWALPVAAAEQSILPLTPTALPTGGAARFRGGLSASDFVHVHSVQRITRGGLEALAPTILPLAEAEGLGAHADSIRVRLRRQRTPKKSEVRPARHSLGDGGRQKSEGTEGT